MGGAMNWFRGKGPGKLKYANKPVVDGGLRFDSTGEFKRWCVLRLLEKGHAIKNLERQKRYKMEVNGVHICTYVADFAYSEYLAMFGWQDVVEDFKSPATMSPIFAIKRKLMKACHGIEVRVTGKGVK